MTVLDYLAFIYPAYASASPEAVLTAELISADYIPHCLTPVKQIEAQALYMAYLLEDVAARESGGNVSGVAGPLIHEKEGQLERRYADATKNVNATFRDNSYYGRWKELNDLCAFGAIVTRFG